MSWLDWAPCEVELVGGRYDGSVIHWRGQPPAEIAVDIHGVPKAAKKKELLPVARYVRTEFSVAEKRWVFVSIDVRAARTG